MEIEIDLKLLGGLFCMVISLFIALINLSLLKDFPAYKLSLTVEGCAYAQSIALPVEKHNGQCSVVTRFLPYAISSGGVLYLNDGKTISITDSMLLATAELDTRLPLTQAQRERWKWVYVWLGVMIVAGVATLIYCKLK